MPLTIEAGRNSVGQPQMSIDDESGGYRIAGGKYDGGGQVIIKATLDRRGADQIRGYLDKHFPVKAE